MTPAEVIVAEAAIFALGAGSVLAARSVALAAIAAARETVAAAREAVEKNWVRGGITITARDARYLKSPEAAPRPGPETAAESIAVKLGDRRAS